MKGRLPPDPKRLAVMVGGIEIHFKNREGMCMKRLCFAIGIVIAMSWIGQTTFAEGIDLANLDMVSIKSISIEKKDRLIALVTLVMKNSSGLKLRLKNADLKVIIEEQKGDQDKKSTVHLGDAKVDSFEIDSAKDPQTPTLKNFPVNVDLGPITEEKTMQRLIDLTNMVCDPSRQISIVLKGKTVAGVANPRGWVDRENYSFELKWHPSIQREILLQ
jgi:hypothetical protein